MDATETTSRLSRRFPGAILQKRRFGRSDQTTVWIETKSLVSVARDLCGDEGGRFDWLENLSVMQMEDALIATYFLRSSRDERASLILRATAVIIEDSSAVELPSVASVWITAAPMEAEAAEMFGIRFLDPEGALKAYPMSRLPEDWRGFPMRKAYVFPTEVLGIAHSRSRVSAGADPGEGAPDPSGGAADPSPPDIEKEAAYGIDTDSEFGSES